MFVLLGRLIAVGLEGESVKRRRYADAHILGMSPVSLLGTEPVVVVSRLALRWAA